MATAGKATLVDVSSDGGATWVNVDGVNDVSFSPKKDTLDKTRFGGPGCKEKFQGLADGNIQINADYIGADAGQVALRNCYDNETQIRARVRPDGVAGYYVDGTVFTHQIKSTVAGKVAWTCTFEFTAKPVAV